MAREQSEFEILPIVPGGHLELYSLFADVVARGDGFPQLPPLSWTVFEEVWVRPVTVVVGAHLHGRLVGAYYLKPNFPGMGAHIANAGYLVAREHRRRGVGRRLVEDSVARAPSLGFDSIQFNFVFADNPARSLYEELGFGVIGRIPGALGDQDALIYWRSVGDT
jgi:ribosomal protein S18 acetylase RimI-like enzyme